jgi:hypothetical protein
MMPADIVARGGAVLTLAARSQFRSSTRVSEAFPQCAGTGEFHYYLDGEGMRLASITLHAPPPPADPADSATVGPLQHCFDRLAREWVKEQKSVLSQPAITEFGRAFIARCM